MKDIRIFLEDRELILYDGFTIPWEEVSPVAGFSLRMGDYSLNLSFPGAENVIAFKHAHHIEINGETVYTMRVESSAGNIRGVFLMQDAEEDADDVVEFKGALISNPFGIEAFEKKLHEVITGGIDLGSTSEAIAAAAKAHNDIFLSHDGVAGSVIKFPLHYNPGFYGDANPYWFPGSVSDWELSNSGSDEIKWWWYPEVYYNRFYIAALNATWVDNNASLHPMEMGILNYSHSNGNIATNAEFGYEQRYVDWRDMKIRNFRSLVPWLQFHHLVRLVAQGLGWKVGGDLMNDVNLQQLLVYSNYALDESTGRAVADGKFGTNIAYEHDAADDITVYPPLNDIPNFDDPEGMYIAAGNKVRFLAVGAYAIRLSAYLWIENNSPYEDDYMTYNINFRTPGGADLRGTSMRNVSATVPAGTQGYYKIELDYVDMFADGEEFVLACYPVVMSTVLDEYFHGVFTAEILQISVTIDCISDNRINKFKGYVPFAELAPDMTVGSFFETLRQWKNLEIKPDLATKTLYLNYAEKAHSTSAPTVDYTPYVTKGSSIEYEAQQKFKMQWGNLPDESEEEYVVFDFEVDAATDLEQANDIGLKAYVRNENRIYNSIEKEIETFYTVGVTLIWEAGKRYYPALRLGAEGEEIEIMPNVGPVPMGYVIKDSGARLMPVFDDAGRSDMFETGGSRHAFAVAQWVGNDVMPGDEQTFQPLATAGQRATSGLLRLPESLDLAAYDYPLRWKKTLEMMARAAVKTVELRLPIAELLGINWLQRFLVNNTAFQAVRRFREIGEDGLVEMELRKLSGTANIVYFGQTSKYVKVVGKSFLSGRIVNVDDFEYNLAAHPGITGLITKLRCWLDEGSCDVDLKIDGISLGTLAVGTAETELVYVEDNEFGPNSDIEIHPTNMVDAVGLNWTFTYTVIE